MIRLNVGNQNKDQGKLIRKAVSLSRLSLPLSVLFIASVFLTIRGSLLLLSAPAWTSAQPVLPLNPWFNYYGFPWNMSLFGAFFAVCIYRYKRKGFYLNAFTYCAWELISVTYSNPLTPVYLVMLLLSANVIREDGFFRPSWKGLSILLGYRIITSSYAQQLPYFGPGSSCGLILCSGTDPLTFALEQVIYTLMVFVWVNESLGHPLLPRLRKDAIRVFEKVRRAGPS